MKARIYKPAKNATQSGEAHTKSWIFEYEPAIPQAIEPLMGWTASSDMRRQVRLAFDTLEEAKAFAEKSGIPYQIQPEHKAKAPVISYADNFKFNRREPWSH